MKKLFKSVKYLALACALSVGMAGTAVLFASCDNSTDSQDSTNSSTQVNKIELSDIEVLIGETYTLSVNAETAVWSSSDTSIATVENGIVTGIKEGTVTITVTADGETATCIATIKKASSVPVLVVESNDWTLKLGDDATLDAVLKVGDKLVETTFTYESVA